MFNVKCEAEIAFSEEFRDERNNRINRKLIMRKIGFKMTFEEQIRLR